MPAAVVSDFIVANSERTPEGWVYRGPVPFVVRCDLLEGTVTIAAGGREEVLASPQRPRCRPAVG